eukprot:4429618-Amphidinium_carterae.1
MNSKVQCALTSDSHPKGSMVRFVDTCYWMLFNYSTPEGLCGHSWLLDDWQDERRCMYALQAAPLKRCRLLLGA